MNSRRTSLSRWSWWTRFCVLTTALAEIVSANPTVDDTGDTTLSPDTWITLQDWCQDSHAECRRWAELGECAVNPDFMEPHCPHSCNSCLTDPACEDMKDQCVAWSRRGECESNPGYMLQYCPTSCNAVGTRSEGGHRKFLPMEPTITNAHGPADIHGEDDIRGSTHNKGLGYEEGGGGTIFTSEGWQAGGGGKQDSTAGQRPHMGCGVAVGLDHGEGGKDRKGEPTRGSLGLSSIDNTWSESRRQGDNGVSGHHEGLTREESTRSKRSEELSHGWYRDAGKVEDGGVMDEGSGRKSDTGNRLHHPRTKRTIMFLGGGNEQRRRLRYPSRFQDPNCNAINSDCGRLGGEMRQVAYPRQQPYRQRTLSYIPQLMPQIQAKLGKIGQLMSFFQQQQQQQQQQQPGKVYSPSFVPRQPQVYRLQVLRQPMMRCGLQQVSGQPQVYSHHLMYRAPHTYREQQ